MNSRGDFDFAKDPGCRELQAPIDWQDIADAWLVVQELWYFDVGII